MFAGNIRLTCLLGVVAILVACSAGFADSFTNGGFESGGTTGWILGGGTWTAHFPLDGPPDSNPIYTYSGDPGKSSLVTPGPDPNTNNSLNMVLDGGYAFRLNNQDNDYHFSTLTQTVKAWNSPNIYFAWAAVLDKPTNQTPHNAYQTPHFSISLHDDTTNAYLYNVAFDVYNPPSGVTWTQGAAATVGDAGVWWYSPWVTAKLSTAANQGDTLTLSVLAADCGLGGHGGYAYVDYFGADQPPSPPNSGGTPELGTFALMGISMLPMAGVAMRRRRRKA